jgi:TRAP-type C4-dicarboxylate transport system permease large subunit
VSELFAAFSESKLLVIIIIMIVYMIGGCFMDGLALVVLTMPIIFPTIQALNIDPIWFGVLICVVGELGMITPPVGINVYVLKGVVEDVPLGTIFRGVTPFIFATIVCMIILMVFPQVSTFLPGLITY